MKSLLEEMHRNNFSLKNDSQSSFKEHGKLLELIETNIGKLKPLLDDAGKERLESLVDCQQELLSLCCRDEFITGFRLGGRIVMEILLGADDMELQD